MTAAAAAADFCRQQLSQSRNTQRDSGESCITCDQALSLPPPSPSLSSIPILLAVLSPAFISQPSPYTLLSLLVSIGVSSDTAIPYISHEQLARIGVPSHSTHTLLSLVLAPTCLFILSLFCPSVLLPSHCISLPSSGQRVAISQTHRPLRFALSIFLHFIRLFRFSFFPGRSSQLAPSSFISPLPVVT